MADGDAQFTDWDKTFPAHHLTVQIRVDFKNIPQTKHRFNS